MDISGKKVAVLVADYFEQAEFEEPISALKEAGAEVTVIAAEDKQLHGLQHVKIGDTFTADLLLRDATDEDYDALVLPGGAMNADVLRMVPEAQEWVRDFLEGGKPLAVICHAPWVLVSADVLDGRRLTSYHTIQDDIRNAGGEWVDERVVVDGNLITSRQPDDLPAFNDALIAMLAQAPPNSIVDDIVIGHEAATEDDSDAALDERATEDEARLRALGYDKQRDQIDAHDQQDILAEEDESDPDELHPSRAVPSDERDGTE